MDFYAKKEKDLRQLHEETDKDIRTVLTEKGYKDCDVCGPFGILSDRLLINSRHTDNISTDDLLRYLRDAYHVLPKFN